jgi:hypothetical protein
VSLALATQGSVGGPPPSGGAFSQLLSDCHRTPTFASAHRTITHVLRLFWSATIPLLTKSLAATTSNHSRVTISTFSTIHGHSIIDSFFWYFRSHILSSNISSSMISLVVSGYLLHLQLWKTLSTSRLSPVQVIRPV